MNNTENKHFGTDKKKVIVNITWKMLLKRFLFFLPPLSLIILVGVNYFIDAENLYSQQYEKIIARNILSGNHITNISKYNDREFQKQLISQLKECPDIIVIGSSRTMMINNSISFWTQGGKKVSTILNTILIVPVLIMEYNIIK